MSHRLLWQVMSLTVQGHLPEQPPHPIMFMTKTIINCVPERALLAIFHLNNQLWRHHTERNRTACHWTTQELLRRATTPDVFGWSGFIAHGLPCITIKLSTSQSLSNDDIEYFIMTQKARGLWVVGTPKLDMWAQTWIYKNLRTTTACPGSVLAVVVVSVVVVGFSSSDDESSLLRSNNTLSEESLFGLKQLQN